DLLVRALTVAQQTWLAAVVQHAAAHRNQERQDVAGDAGTLERGNPARREREVDRPPARRARRELGAALVDDGRKAAPREHDREQAAGRSAADDRDARAGARAAHAAHA